MVFHADPDEMDFSRCSRIQENLEDLKVFTFWGTKRCPPPSLDYECTLLHGSPAWFGKGFLLLGSQIGLPDTIEENAAASVDERADSSGGNSFDDDGLAMRQRLCRDHPRPLSEWVQQRATVPP